LILILRHEIRQLKPLKSHFFALYTLAKRLSRELSDIDSYERLNRDT